MSVLQLNYLVVLSVGRGARVPALNVDVLEVEPLGNMSERCLRGIGIKKLSTSCIGKERSDLLEVETLNFGAEIMTRYHTLGFDLGLFITNI